MLTEILLNRCLKFKVLLDIEMLIFTDNLDKWISLDEQNMEFFFTKSKKNFEISKSPIVFVCHTGIKGSCLLS